MQTQMKAWTLDGLGGPLAFVERAVPEVRPGSVLVRVEAAALLSYQEDYVAGRLLHYSPPSGPFVIGTSAVGTIAAIGRDVWHLEVGHRVMISPHYIARENVDDPAQLLLGLTAYGAGKRIQADWRDGMFAELALVPKEVVTPIVGLDDLDAATLCAATRPIVPFGGLLRGRLAVGETVVITGATGAFGSAAVLLALAMGAARVVAAGRDPRALATLLAVAGQRCVPVTLTGDVATDVAALRTAAGGGAHLAFDIVGRATDPNATLAALRSLRRNGRLVLMGSLQVPLPIDYFELMINNWELLGQFMFPPDAPRRLFDLVRSGLLDLRAIRTRPFPLADLRAAMSAASSAGSLELVVLVLS